MTSKSSRARTLGRLLREALAIFSGVAMALAGQAWFESRADRQHEQELLGAVLQEMERNLEGTTAGLRQIRERRPELQTFHDFIGSSDAALNPDAVVSGAVQLLTTYAARVVSPSLDYALQANNLRLIRNPEVRQMLTSYQDRIRQVREFTDDHQDWTNQMVRTFVIQNAFIDESALASRLGTSFPVSRFKGGGEELIGSREFDNLVLDQLYWHLLIERIMTQITDELPDHMALLRVELQAD